MWRAEFSTYCADVEAKVGAIKNVKAAKHRHESYAKPKGRFVLFFDAYMAVAEQMATTRADDDRADGLKFLNYITDEILVQAAMMADAADEGLLFTRIMDTEEGLDNADYQQHVHDFIRRMQVLFIDEKVAQGKPLFPRPVCNMPR